MKQITIIAASMVFAFAFVGASSVLSQSPGTTSSLRRIPVNAQTITAMPRGRNYVVDLTQRGVKYEFDPRAGQIDFSRVTVRTTQGEVAIGTFLERTFSKNQLSGFKIASYMFVLGTRVPGTLPPNALSLGARNFTCGERTCQCSGRADCMKMIFDDIHLCLLIFCYKLPEGTEVCICTRTSAPA
jgi:hypothetical protein